MKRTSKQNRALHLYFRQLADMLNGVGLDMRAVFKPGVEIPWSEYTVKEMLWRRVQKRQLGTESTTELTSKQISEVYEVLNRHLAQNFGEHLPWPSYQEQMLQDLINNN